MTERSRIYGLLAEFSTATALIEAAIHVRQAGYSQVEAYAPFAVDGLADAVGFPGNRVALMTLLGGLAGGLGGYLLQWYSAVIDYPINVGGRPLHSWPSFIPVTFEMTILGAALAAVIGMLAANGLPKLYHPVFNVPEFDLATRNRFFLCLPAQDPAFERDRARTVLNEMQPLMVCEVPA